MYKLTCDKNVHVLTIEQYLDVDHIGNVVDTLYKCTEPALDFIS